MDRMNISNCTATSTPDTIGVMVKRPRRILIENYNDPPEATGANKASYTYYASRLAGVFGDSLLVSVPRQGEHMFSRADGRWESGPSIALEHAHLLNIDAINDALAHDKSWEFEWVPEAQPHGEAGNVHKAADRTTSGALRGYGAGLNR